MMGFFYSSVVVAALGIFGGIGSTAEKPIYTAEGNTIWVSPGMGFGFGKGASLIPVTVRFSNPFYWEKNPAEALVAYSRSSGTLEEIPIGEVLSENTIKSTTLKTFAVDQTGFYFSGEDRQKVVTFPVEAVEMAVDPKNTDIQVTNFSLKGRLCALYKPDDPAVSAVCSIIDVADKKEIESFPIKEYVSVRLILKMYWIDDRYVFCFMPTRRINEGFVIDLKDKSIVYPLGMKGLEYFLMTDTGPTVLDRAKDGKLVTQVVGLDRN